MTDWLLTKTLDAIAAARPEMAKWCKDKAIEEAGRDRLGALRFVCNTLDANNREIAARAIGVDIDDLEACGRVLREI